MTFSLWFWSKNNILKTLPNRECFKNFKNGIKIYLAFIFSEVFKFKKYFQPFLAAR